MDQTETRSHGARVEAAQGQLCIAKDQVGLVSRLEVEVEVKIIAYKYEEITILSTCYVGKYYNLIHSPKALHYFINTTSIFQIG